MFEGRRQALRDALRLVQCKLRASHYGKNMNIEFEWHFHANESMKNVLKEKIRKDISGYDEMRHCQAETIKVAIGSSDHGFSKIGGNIRCQCEEPLAEFVGNSDGSKITYTLVSHHK